MRTKEEILESIPVGQKSDYETWEEFRNRQKEQFKVIQIELLADIRDLFTQHNSEV